MTIIETVNMFTHNPTQNNAWVLTETIDRYLTEYAPAVEEYKEKRNLVHPETRIIMDEIIAEYELVKSTYAIGKALARWEGHQVRDCKTVEEFLNKYYKADRYTGRGEEYAKVLLDHYKEDFENRGYVIISQHDNVTGKVVALFKGVPSC
jgi:hypothetical protein